MTITTYIYYLWGIFIIIVPCLADILVIRKDSNKTVEIIGDLPALFGPAIPIGGLKGYVVYTSPPDACEPPKRPPIIPKYNGLFIALVRRYNCTFVDKVLNSQVSGYHAVIVRNVGSNSVEVMSGDHDTNLVRIPSVFVGQDDGILIEESFQYDSGFFVELTDDQPFNIQNYLLPFAITIGICFILMLTLMLVKCIRDYRRTRRHRLSSRALKKLPIHKFKKGDPYECCAVCLEDYVDNDKLRILPCQHAYHTKCIDPWLTKNRRVCPFCKRKVITEDERPSDIDTDSEDETAPLINSEAGTQGGTFASQRENPFREAQRRVEQMRSRAPESGAGVGEGRYGRLAESDSDSDDERMCPRGHPTARLIDDGSEEEDHLSPVRQQRDQTLNVSEPSPSSSYISDHHHHLTGDANATATEAQAEAASSSPPAGDPASFPAPAEPASSSPIEPASSSPIEPSQSSSYISDHHHHLTGDASATATEAQAEAASSSPTAGEPVVTIEGAMSSDVTPSKDCIV